MGDGSKSDFDLGLNRDSSSHLYGQFALSLPGVTRCPHLLLDCHLHQDCAQMRNQTCSGASKYKISTSLKRRPNRTLGYTDGVFIRSFGHVCQSMTKEELVAPLAHPKFAQTTPANTETLPACKYQHFCVCSDCEDASYQGNARLLASQNPFHRKDALGQCAGSP